MYFPKTPKHRPLLFDIGDTLIDFCTHNIIPDLKKGPTLAHEYMVEQGITVPTVERYMWACRWRFTVDFVKAELLRREVDILATLKRVHAALDLPVDHDLLMKVCGKSYEPTRDTGTPEEGVHDVLAHFRSREHPMAIVSNTMVPGPILDDHLAREGLLEFFDVRVYSSIVGVKKPRARIFREALVGLNVKPQDSVFIGDKTFLDIKGAKRLGMTTVLKRRFGNARIWRNKPDFIVKRLDELPAVIDELGMVQ
jgi:HAD superfamily hydrolase (TIGR01662 family)